MGGTDLDFIYVVYKRGVYEDSKSSVGRIKKV